MKIAITGARGSVGKAVANYCKANGHYVFEINRTEEKSETGPNGEHRTAQGTDYEATLKAFEGADAVIHVAATPQPGKLPDHDLHNANVSGCYVALRACAELGINRISFASSVNAIGLEFSRWSTFDYFPLDHKHKTYAEDPYSLSKWECEQQCDSFVRRYEKMRIASFRMHEVAPVDELERDEKTDKMVLWSHSDPTAVARACLLGVTTEKDDWKSGHEVFYIVSPKNVSYKTRGEKLTNSELAQRYYPNTPVNKDLDRFGFFDCEKAERYFGWTHDE